MGTCLGTLLHRLNNVLKLAAFCAFVKELFGNLFGNNDDIFSELFWKFLETCLEPIHTYNKLLSFGVVLTILIIRLECQLSVRYNVFLCFTTLI